MSIPPQLIRVKRKRDDDAPVEFLQFDDAAKRHRSDSHWAYQRRGPPSAVNQPTGQARAIKPVIHVSQPKDPRSSQKDVGQGNREVAAQAIASSRLRNVRSRDRLAEPRRFHISRAMMASDGRSSPSTSHGGISKKSKPGMALFVERSRRRVALRAQSTAASSRDTSVDSRPEQVDEVVPPVETPERPLKKPSARKQPLKANLVEKPEGAPLPPSMTKRHGNDLDSIAADMNQWVLNEIGNNLEAIELEETEEKRRVTASKLRPKAPAQRYAERHPVGGMKLPDGSVGAVSGPATEDEDDDEDWIIEEYVRIPAHSMAVDISPNSVGWLMLEGEEDSMLFYGNEDDDSDELAEDDEDENAEGHYTADYPEDEVDTDDEYGRQAYTYRRGASDDEEFDNDEYEEGYGSDDVALEGDRDGGEDATMARIRAFNSKHPSAHR